MALYRNLLTKITIISLLVVIIFLAISANVNILYNNAELSVPKYIQVGLAEYYQNKSEITMLNKKISVGYNADNFVGEVTFTSEGGFKIKNNVGYRLYINTTYTGYYDAVDAIAGNSKLIPMLNKIGNWTITSKAFSSEEEALEYKSEIMQNYGTIAILQTNVNQIVLTTAYNDELILISGMDFPLFKSIETETTQVMKFNERQYRGYIKFVRKTNITAINVVEFDQYLYAVVGSEMISTWSNEALKAQAVASRNFVLKRIEGKKYTDYDIVDTTADQVYKGFKAEYPSTIRAVTETAREFLFYNSSLVDTFYYSTSGGVTEEPQNVWGSVSIPYLKSKKDVYEKANAHYNWEVIFSASDIETALAKTGESVGSVTSITTEKGVPSGRVLSLIIKGTKGTKTITKEAIRTFFGNVPGQVALKSRNFELIAPNGTTETTTQISILPSTGTISKTNLQDTRLIQNGLVVKNANAFGVDESIYILGREGSVAKKVITQTETKSANGNYVIHGSGYGHGVGMSQYGAKDMAEAGFDYKQILTFYYTGVEVIKK